MNYWWAALQSSQFLFTYLVVLCFKLGPYSWAGAPPLELCFFIAKQSLKILPRLASDHGPPTFPFNIPGTTGNMPGLCDGVSLTFYSSGPWTTILSIFASQVAGIARCVPLQPAFSFINTSEFYFKTLVHWNISRIQCSTCLDFLIFKYFAAYLGRIRSLVIRKKTSQWLP
jgi:hypothetical protein